MTHCRFRNDGEDIMQLIPLTLGCTETLGYEGPAVESRTDGLRSEDDD